MRAAGGSWIAFPKLWRFAAVAMLVNRPRED
ncbi:hypothetical protein BOSE21B_30700 [Bosea sp. 21B]|nr:hypothetical protein BOSE21B_30700 [Bosea sp. 21B]VXC79981.1 hypothetical protein BOSE125_50337 [Bosea sp. 125]